MEDLKLNNCIICIEDILTDIEYLPCAHSFHRNCINEWMESNNTCPICKIPIFISSPEQLRIYNYYKRIEEENKNAENQFFQQLSSGLFDRVISNNQENEIPQNINSDQDENNNIYENIDRSDNILYAVIPSDVGSRNNNTMSLFDILFGRQASLNADNVSNELNEINNIIENNNDDNSSE